MKRVRRIAGESWNQKRSCLRHNSIRMLEGIHHHRRNTRVSCTDNKLDTEKHPSKLSAATVMTSSSTQALPTSTRCYRIQNANLHAPADKFRDTLILSDEAIPSLGPNDVLVQIHAVSLNWRDIAIATDTYIRPTSKLNVVACSDGAGVVLGRGSDVTRVNEGDRVAATFIPGWIDGLVEQEMAVTARGAEVDGMLTEYAVFNEEELVKIPDYLSFEEASTLPCAGLTAWNALFGHGRDEGFNRCLRRDETVLTEGTGGVSLFAAQFALGAGADVISTTSSPEKARKIEQITKVPAHNIINYVEIPQWGTEAKRVSRDGKGVDFVVEVTGSPSSIRQAYAAAKPEAQITVIGLRGAAKADASISKTRAGASINKEDETMNILEVFHHIASIRRILVGSRKMFEDMNEFMAEKEIHPVVDGRIFKFEEANEAFMYLWQGKQFGNIVVRVR